MKKNLFLTLIFCMLFFMAGHAKPMQWTTPYNYQYYDCAPKTNVKSFTITHYDQHLNPTKTQGFDFDVEGNLVREYSITATDTTNIITYKYKRGRLVDVASPLYKKIKLRYNEEGYLVEVRFFEDWKGKQTLSRTYYLEYNSEGLLHSYRDKKEAIGYLSEGKIEDRGWEQEICVLYHNGLRSSYVLTNRNFNTNLNQKEEYSYLESGFAKDLTITDLNSEKVLQIVQFSYKYDDKGNWIERTGRVKGRLQGVEKKQFKYYTEAEMLAAIAPIASNNGGISFNRLKSILVDYYGSIEDRIELLSWQYSGGTVLLGIVLFLTLTGMIWVLVRMIKRPFFKRHVMSNGMSRLWMYDSSRYLNVLSYFGIALGCFIGAILLIALVGGIAWLNAWIIRILFIIIIWVGIILTVIGALAALAKSEEVVIVLIPGIIILCFSNTLEEWGESIVYQSFSFLQRVNMIGWGFNFFVNLWDIILLIFFAPIILFLLVALVIILVNTLLNGFEWVVTRIYSIRRPCPICGNTQTPDYIVEGKVHPVKLHPGTYGVFTQRSPVTGKLIPTMLMNGKGKLIRKCPHCGTIINADTKRTFGTDIHIGFVGPRSSGKSYLLYSGLSDLVKSHSDYIQQIDADQETKIGPKKQRIDARQGIQTNVANKYRAVQLMVSSKLRPVPYHLFFYDVAGEKFNAASSSYKTAMDFYKNVQSIVFIIDPSMIDYTGIPASEKVKNWANSPSVNQGEKYRIDNSFSVLKDILESVGRKPKKIDFTFVCTKADMGYFEADGFVRKDVTERGIEQFVRNSLGLGNLVNSAKASFDSVHFFEISVTDGDTSKLKHLFEFLVKQKGVSIG